VDWVFLDANVLFSAAYKPTSILRALWKLAATELLSSPLAIQQAETNLAQARPSQLPDLATLLASVRVVPDPQAGAALPAGVVLPAQDAPIMLSALDANATHLLTGDVKHFGPYFGRAFGGMVILRPAVYLQSRQSKP
jgi:hypothetical protein